MTALLVATGGPQFVTPATLTIDTLHATFPPGPDFRGMYGRVSDFAGSTDKVLRCDFDAFSGLYGWVPTSRESGRSVPLAPGALTLQPLKTASAIAFTGAGLLGLGTTMNVTLGTTFGMPGDVKELRAPPGLLGALNILGLGLGSGIQLLGGGYQRHFLEWNGSGLSWVRLL